MKTPIELTLTRKKRLQQKIIVINDPVDYDKLSLDLFKNKLLGPYHYKKEMARKYLSQMAKKMRIQRATKCTSPSKVYRPIQPKISLNLAAAHPLKTGSHMGEARSTSHGALGEVCSLRTPPNTLDKGEIFAKRPPGATKTVDVPPAIKELFAKRPPGVTKTVDVPPAIKELFKSRPTEVCKVEPFEARSDTKELEVIEERVGPPVIVGPFEARSGPWGVLEQLKTNSDMFGKAAIETRARHTVLVGPFETRPGHWGRVQPLKASRTTLEKVESFEASSDPEFEPNPATLEKAELFETSCHQQEPVGPFESRSGSLKKLRSLLQANIPKQVTPFQMREITAAVKEAIKKATNNL